MYNSQSRSVPEIRQHVAGTLSNQQTTTNIHHSDQGRNAVSQHYQLRSSLSQHSVEDVIRFPSESAVIIRLCCNCVTQSVVSHQAF